MPPLASYGGLRLLQVNSRVSPQSYLRIVSLRPCKFWFVAQNRVFQLYPSFAASEIKDSKSIIENRLGRPVRYLAYPFGDRGSVGSREFSLARDAELCYRGHNSSGPRVAETCTSADHCLQPCGRNR
jgi:hypothetical protein